MPDRAVPVEEVRHLVAAVLAQVVPEEVPAGPSDRPSEEPALPPTPGSAIADIGVGADHGGFHLKQRIVTDLREHGFSVHDCGTESPDSVDYPDHALAVARLVAGGGTRWGILVDGAGIGSAIAANKVPGVRAATCWDVSSARNSREHNHANVLALGAGLVGEALALQIVQTWLQTPWAGGRHAARVAKITEIERRFLKETA